MLPVTRIPDESAARRLARALSAAGMGCEIDRGKAGDWIIWLHEHARLDEARRLQETLAADPAAALAAESAVPAPPAISEPAPQREPRRSQRVESQSVPRTPVTWVLLALCLLTAIEVGLDQKTSPLKDALHIGQGGSPLFADILHGQFWRLITPVFIHLSALHLMLNGLMLWQLGRLIEVRLGATSLASQVLLYAIASNIGQYLFNGPAFGGMSGVIYGLFGCAWIRGRLDPASGLRLRGDAVFMMMAWFAVCWMGMLPIANMAHTVGLVTGMAWGWASRPRHQPA